MASWSKISCHRCVWLAAEYETVVAFYPGQIKSALSQEFSTENESFKFSMVEPLYSAAAPLGQRVPLTPPTDFMDQVQARLTYDNLSPVFHRMIDKIVPGVERKKRAKELTTGGLIGMQDRMLSIGRLIDQIKKNGGFISNENDTYLRETLFHGRTDTQLVANHRDYYKPLEDAVKAVRVTKHDYEEAKNLGENAKSILEAYDDYKFALAELYLYAQHAEERNALMRERNENVRDERARQYEAGSGLTDLEAQAILGWFANKSFGKDFNDPTNENSVRSRMRALIKNTNDVRVDYGLNPDFRTMIHADGFPMDAYQDYVPIRGFLKEAQDVDEDMSNFAKTGKGFNIRGKEDYSALGRRSLGNNLMAHAIMQNQEAVVRGNKNKVAQSFYQLILDNPMQMDAYAAIIEKPQDTYRYDSPTGTVKHSVDQSLKTDPDVLKLKVNGEQKYIEIRDKRIQKALAGRSSLGSAGVGPLLKGLLTLNRYLASVRTSYNPEFLISNFFRDLQSAMINLTEYEKAGLHRKVSSSIIPALTGIRRALRKEDMTSEWAQVYEEFRRMGGQTAFYGIRDLQDTINRINDDLSEDVSGPVSKVKKPLAAIFKFVEDYNLVVENGVRVATYKALRDEYLARSGDPNNPANQNRAREMAAFAAKNLTVNFNMGGELKPLMTSLYLFYNASLQGSMAMLNTFIRSKRVRAVWGSILVAGAVQDMLMSMLSEEDDDGEKKYDKIKPHILEHNMVFMDPFGISERGYFQIPMPYLMNGIYNFGRMVSKTARGEADMGELMSSGGMTLLNSLNPYGEANNLVNFFAPSVLDPVVDHYMNENFAGNPIVPPENPFSEVNEVASQRYWANTNPAYITISDWMSKLTGRKGDYIPGVVEVSPNKVEYAVEWATGGVGPFLARAAWLAAGGVGLAPLEEMTPADIPFVRKFYGSVTERNDLQTFIEGRDQVLRIRAAIRDANKEGDKQLAKRIRESYPVEAGIHGRINAIENARKKKSTQIKKIRENPRLSDERKEQIIKSLKERQNKIVGDGNKVLTEAGIQ